MSAAKQSVLVLGAGRVGAEVARDLATTFAVASADRDEARLREALGGSPVDLLPVEVGDPSALESLAAPYDYVVDALPGFLGFRTLETLLTIRKNVVDIAFAPEDPFALDALARRHAATAIVDMGVAPGMSNAILGHVRSRWRAVEHFECLVGGLPVVRTWPFEYKAPFSPADVLEEYTRPARYVEQGRLVTRAALTDIERIEVDGVGTLESFNTDGLRTLLRLGDVPFMKEKTLRYPGHARLMEALREAGLLDPEPRWVGESRVAPRDVTAAVLEEAWRLDEGESELTVMRVTLRGVDEDGRDVEQVWRLLDRGDAARGVSSMARTTGYACTAALHLLARGDTPGPGILAPEDLASDADAFASLLAYQAERGVAYDVETTYASDSQ